MGRIKDQPEAFAYSFATMTRSLRTKVWAASGPRNPARLATSANPLIIDIDASLVHVHSDKENSAGTYKGGYGFSPMIAMADYGKTNGTGEVLAVQLRPGNRGANSAKSHIEVLNQALAQLPDAFYDEHGNLQAEKILVRTDSAGSSREFLHHLQSLGIQFSTSYSLPVIKERFIRWIDEKKYWEPALTADGDQRDDAWVIDATKVIELKDYPPGTRIYLRAEPLHPGAKANLFDTDGNRVTAFLTNSPRFNVAFLDARHRARGRCENRIKTLKNTGLGKLNDGVGHQDLLLKLCDVDLLIIDDFLTVGIDQNVAGDLFAILAERENRLPTIIASQTDPSYWVQAMPDRIAGDSIVNRLATNTRWIVLGNTDMRKLKHDEARATTDYWE